MDNFKLEGAAAAMVCILLVGSLGLNVWSLTRKPEVLAIPVNGSAVSAVMDNGQKNPLSHVPSGPTDAVGMPNATGVATQ